MNEITLRLTCDGAETLLRALELDSITVQDLDRLLSVPGVRATVANTTKYLPDHTESAFRAAVGEYVETGLEPWGHFCLAFAAEHAAEARALIATLQADPQLLTQVQEPLNRYLPACGPLDVAVHGVVGGVSDGFVLDGHPEPAFFMALDRAQGDAQGVRLNMTHELYHTAQEAARSRVPGLTARILDPGAASPAVRLLTTVLDEGTATWVARSMLEGDGPYLAMWRSAYEKNAPAEKVAANFALFEQLLAGLAHGTMSWDDAYKTGFSGLGPPLYFVGFEMARAIEATHGPQRIGTYFARHPTAFFEDFVALAPGTFSPTTEELLASDQP